MTTADVEITCYRHRKRPTQRRCTRCGQPACPECLRDAPVGSHCLACIRAANKGTRWQEVPAARATRPPVVTGVLIAARVAGFAVAQQSAVLPSGVHEAVRRWAMGGTDVAAGQWYRMLTGAFVSSQPTQLLLGILSLALLGSRLERDEGSVRLALLFLVAILAGAAVGYASLPPDLLWWGASAGIAGIAGAELVRSLRWHRSDAQLPAVFLVLTAVVAVSGGHPALVSTVAAGALVGAVFGLATTRAARRREAWRTLLPLVLIAAVAVFAVWSVGAGALRHDATVAHEQPAPGPATPSH